MRGLDDPERGLNSEGRKGQESGNGEHGIGGPGEVYRLPKEGSERLGEGTRAAQQLRERGLDSLGRGIKGQTRAVEAGGVWMARRGV